MHCLYMIAALVLCAVGEIQGHPFQAPPGVLAYQRFLDPSGVAQMDVNHVFDDAPEEPKRCVAPSKFEAHTTQVLMQPGASGSPVTFTGKMSYDADGKRVRMSYSSVGASPKIEIDTLTLYKTGVMYTRNVATGTCRRSKLPGAAFPTLQVPPTAKYAGRSFLGKSFKIDQWWLGETSPVFSMTWTGDGSCLPISMNSFGKGSFTLYSIYDITPGIKSPAVWDIPKGCEKAGLEETGPLPLFFTQFFTTD